MMTGVNNTPVVHIIDDEPAVRDSLCVLVEAHGMVCRNYESAEAFLETRDAAAEGCLLLDLRMPGGMSGQDLMKELQSRGDPIPVIVVSGHGDIAAAVRAMKHGAVDFIEKPPNDTEILDAVQRALQLEEQVRDDAAAMESIAGRLADLTPRERDVLDQLVIGNPNKVIAHELDISPRTVEIHRARVMEKMQARNLSHLVRMALRAGLDPDD